MDRVLKLLQEAKYPLSLSDIAERAETTRQNAFNIVKERLYPAGLVHIVGESPTGGDLFEWDAGAWAKGVRPAPRKRASRARRPKDDAGADETTDLKRQKPSSLANEVSISRTRLRVVGGRVEVLEVSGMSQAELLEFAQPLIGATLEIKELRIGSGGLVFLDVDLAGQLTTIELKPTADAET